MRIQLSGLLCVVALLSGCNSGGTSSQNSNNSTQSNSSTIVTVERGAVINATVKDANGQIATVESNNKYKFVNNIVYPITVTGGFIDLDDSGDKSVGDLELTIPLTTYSGTNITMITTAISDSDVTKREQKLQALATSLGTTKEELLKLPSQSYDSSILSNELFKAIKEDENIGLSTLVENIETNGLKTKFTNKKAQIDTTKATKEFALNLEQEYIQELINAGKVNTITYSDLKEELSGKSFELSLFHVNDIHSHITSEALTYSVNGASKSVQTGGYARIITKLNELKKVKPNSLTLNAGDTFQGTLYYSLFKGEADAVAMNLISWDAYTLGNHEFDDGDEGLKTFLDRLNDNIPVISSNVVPSNNSILKNYWTPYTIKELNGQKIGIIGIDVVSKTKNSSNPSSEITFLDEVETAQKYIDELKTQGINKIVVLTHQGFDVDLEMAKKLTGVDVIIGGDSHTLLGNFSNIGLNSISNEYPVKTKSKDNKRVCIAQSWEYAHILGNMDVMFDDNGDIIACAGNPLLLVGEDLGIENKNVAVVTEDTDAVAKIKEFEDKVSAKKATVIGVSSEKLGHNRIPGDKRDGVSILPLGSDIAPIVAKSFYDLSNLADACIQNAGGVRVAVEAGNITIGDAYTLLPFSNTLFEIKITGSEIKQVLEDALNATYAVGGSTGSFPYSYGLKYDINVSLGNNNRISNLEIKDRKTGVWGNIEAGKMYTIVTNSFTAGGKDGYVTFKTVQDQRGKGVDTYLDYAMSYVKYVESKTANKENVTKLPQIDHPIKSYKDANGNVIPSADITAPILQSANISNDGLSIVLTYSENLTGSVSSSDYSISNIAISNATISGKTVTLSVSSAIVNGTTIGQITYNGTTLSDASGNKIIVGTSSISVTNSSTQKDTSAKTFTPNSSTTQGSSDASSAIALDENYMLVIDDEANVVRIYPRNGGSAIKEISYDSYVSVGNELDAEAMTRINNDIYIIGSHSNKKSGAEENNREFILKFNLIGTGSETNLTFADSYSNLENDLVTWDKNNTHGKGANYYGFEVSAQTTIIPENVNGFSIEGLTTSLDNTQFYLGFRAPVVNAQTRNKALIIPVNINSIMDGSTTTNTGATFGEPIELNLGGRAIRAIEKSNDGSGYLILAGLSTASSSDVENNFRLFRWNGLSGDANQPTEIDTNLDILRATTLGSFETIVDVNSNQSGTWIQLLTDNGDTIWSGKSVVSKDLPANEQKFQGFWVKLSEDISDLIAPTLVSTTPLKNSLDVSISTNITLSFNEGIKAGNGKFIIKKVSDNSIVEEILANSTNVTYSFNKIVINPTSNLEYSTAYYLAVENDAISDNYGNTYSGISDSNFNFTTMAAPQTYSLLITEVNSNATGNDFFEIFNYGTTDVNLSGWKWHDNGATFSTATALGDVIIPAGKTLIVTVSTDANAFRTTWNLDSNALIASVGGQGLGSGDAVVVFNDKGAVVTAFNYGTSSITASDGTVINSSTRADNINVVSGHAGIAFGGTDAKASAIWDGVSVITPKYTYAQAGLIGSYSQSTSTNGTGSPSVVGKAPLLVTEVASSTTEGTDYFEIYNYGNTPINLSEMKWDDDSASFTEAVLFGNETIEAGKTIVILSTADTTKITTFKTLWSLGESDKVISNSGAGLGKGDSVVVFDSIGRVVTYINYGIVDKTATDNSVITKIGLGSTTNHTGKALGGTSDVDSIIWDGISKLTPNYITSTSTNANTATNGNFGTPSIFSK